MATTNYLDSNGLKEVWTIFKNTFAQSSSLGSLASKSIVDDSVLSSALATKIEKINTLETKINSLNVSSISVGTEKYITSISQTDGKIAVETADLDITLIPGFNDKYNTIVNEYLPSKQDTLSFYNNATPSATDPVVTKSGLETAISGLSSAMRYVGRVSVDGKDLVDGSTTPLAQLNPDWADLTAKSGDVVLNKSDDREFVWDGTKWNGFGREGSYALANHTHAEYENVQADFNITDTSSDAYIKNKPTALKNPNPIKFMSASGTLKATYDGSTTAQITLNQAAYNGEIDYLTQKSDGKFIIKPDTSVDTGSTQSFIGEVLNYYISDSSELTEAASTVLKKGQIAIDASDGRPRVLVGDGTTNIMSLNNIQTDFPSPTAANEGMVLKCVMGTPVWAKETVYASAESVTV